jgi:signal transduction histidine kinase
VSDHGPGIAEEERHLVFERFYRGGSQTAVRTRGAGIGLAVVKELADRLGATIEVGQTEGGGACLTVGFAATLRPVPREGANNGAT